MILLWFVIFAVDTADAKTGKISPGDGRSDLISSSIAGLSPYDTLYLSSGNYNETGIIIDKPLTLIGSGTVLIDGGSEGDVITVRSDSVTIIGLTVMNSGYSGHIDLSGILVEKSSHVIVQDCRVLNCFFGIYYSDSDSCSIVNNTVVSNRKTETASGNGIHLWKCDRISISSNTVSGHRDGIYLEFVTNSDVLKNRSESNIRYGLHFMFSHNDTYKDNLFRDNGAGVAVMYTKNVTMENNDFFDNKGVTSYGLLLKDITDSRIRNNRFRNNTVAITMEESNRIEIFHNDFQGNGWAMKIQASCGDNVIRNNNYIANTFDITTNGTMVMNEFDNNYWDKYKGYDLDRNQKGDVPYLPVSMYSVIVERIPVAMILYRSFVVTLLERMEKVIPSITPEHLKDNAPLMKPVVHDRGL